VTAEPGPTKTIGIVQSSYIPWKGYFDLINSVDEFILYDDRQYTRRDWRSRNRIKSANGPIWLTIPVASKGRYHQRIDEAEVENDDWRGRHLQTLTQSYARAPHFRLYAPLLEELYLGSREGRLSLVNHSFIAAICSVLGIETTLRWSTDYAGVGVKTERLVSLCEQAGATAYLSGPSARAYLDDGLFEAAGVTVRYIDYSDYPAYPQLHPPFDHQVSILDLLFHVGPEAPRYMKSFGETAP
jgi:WbqC-like protein